MARDSDILVDIEIPVDDQAKAYEAVFEPDGTPKDEAAPKIARVKDEPAEPKTVKADTRDAEIETLRRERDTAAQTAKQIAEEASAVVARERQSRSEAEAEAAKRTDQAMRARWGQVTAEDDHVGGLLTSHKREQLDIKRELKAALDAGDTEKQAELMDRQSTVNAVVFELEKAKRTTASEVEKTRELFTSVQQQRAEADRRAAEKPAPKEEVKQPVQEKPKTPDDWIAQFPRKTANWLRENKEYVTDPDKHKQLMEFANEWATDYGQATLHTPQFIDAMNAKFAKQQEAEEPEQENVVEVETTPKRATQSHSAPVSRASAPTKPSGQSGTKVRLTPDQQNIALSIFPEAKSPSEAYVMYAQGLQKATSEGRFLPRE